MAQNAFFLLERAEGPRLLACQLRDTHHSWMKSHYQAWTLTARKQGDLREGGRENKKKLLYADKEPRVWSGHILPEESLADTRNRLSLQFFDGYSVSWFRDFQIILTTGIIPAGNRNKGPYNEKLQKYPRLRVTVSIVSTLFLVLVPGAILLYMIGPLVCPCSSMHVIDAFVNHTCGQPSCQGTRGLSRSVNSSTRKGDKYCWQA